MYLNFSSWESNHLRPGGKKIKTLNLPSNSPFFMFYWPKFCTHFVFPLMCLCLSGSDCENKLPAYYGLWTFSNFHKSDPLVRIVKHINLVCIIFPYFREVHFNISLPTRWRFFDIRFFQQLRLSFIGALAKLRKAAISLVISIRLSVRPSFRMQQLDSCWMDFFNEILYLGIFRNYVEKIKVSLNSDTNEELCKFMTVSRWNLHRTRKFSDKTWNTLLGFNNFFFRKSWKNIVHPDRPQMTI